MDEWTKLDYYRYCLFQRHVQASVKAFRFPQIAMLSLQEEFQRENQQLRTRRGPRAGFGLRKRGSVRPAAGRIPIEGKPKVFKVEHGELGDRCFQYFSLFFSMFFVVFQVPRALTAEKPIPEAIGSV